MIFFLINWNGWQKSNKRFLMQNAAVPLKWCVSLWFVLAIENMSWNWNKMETDLASEISRKLWSSSSVLQLHQCSWLGILGFGRIAMKTSDAYTVGFVLVSGTRIHKRFQLSITTQCESSEIRKRIETSIANNSLKSQRIYNPQLVIQSTKHTLQYP